MYNCTTLDKILCRVEKVIVTTYLNGKQESVYELLPEDATNKIAGIIVRKYFGEKTRITTAYDCALGCRLIKSANYGNGFRESFKYIY